MGQNIVKMLQEFDPLCGEIRILDVKEYKNKIGKNLIGLGEIGIDMAQLRNELR